LFTSKTDAQIWAMEGNTIMPGLDDYPRRTESTSVADAQRLYDFAKQVGINTLSMWAIQRDNGGCPGTTGSNSCSGIFQNTWDFSHGLTPFTGPKRVRQMFRLPAQLVPGEPASARKVIRGGIRAYGLAACSPRP